MKKELNERQKSFARNIAKGMKPSDAYRASGYKYTNDSVVHAASARIMKNPLVQEYIQELTAKVESNDIMDIQEAQKKLSSYARREPQEGEEGEVLPTVLESIKSIEMLIRAQGGFLDRKQVDVQGGITTVIVRNDVIE